MMSVVSLLLAFSLFGFCVGLPECTPANQCTDLWTAKKCDAVNYCIEEDWSNLKVTGKRDDVCSICLRMVKEARDVLQSNGTREELKEVLEGSCRFFVIKPAVEVCDRLMKQFAEELVNVLSSEMDPEVVCSVSKLCNNVAIWTAEKDSMECVHCNAFVQKSKDSFSSVSSKVFVSGILDVCRAAGSFTDACSHLGLVHGNALYETAKRILMGNPCEASSLCPSDAKPILSDSVTEEQMCPLCKTVMRSLRGRLLRVKSVEEFVENVGKICDELGVSDSTCTLLSSQGFYDKLKSSESLPDLVCYVMHCAEKPKEDVPVWPLVATSNNSVESTNVLDVADYLEAFFPQAKQEKASLPSKPKIDYGDPIESPMFLSPVLIFEESSRNHTEDCKTCAELVKIMSETVKNDDDYLKMYETVCENVENVKHCKQFTDEFSPVFAEAFSRKIPLKEVCPWLVPSCQVPDTSATRDTSPSNDDVTVTKAPCEVCMMVVKMLLDQLENNKTEESIRKTLENFCKYLPEEVTDTCKNLIDEYADDLISMIIVDFNESEICTYLKFCPKRLSLQSNVTDKNFSTFDVQTNEVEDWVDHERESILAAYINSKKHKPVTIERSTEEVLQQFHEVVQECAMCEALVGVISSHQKMQDNNYDFVKNSNSICSMVPRKRKKKCVSMLISYGPSIVHLLTKEKIDPDEVCGRLDLCDPEMQAKVNRPVSAVEPRTEEEEEANECLLGPVFWCANAENAEKCGTFLHCQETVWKNWKSPPKKQSNA